MIGNPDKIPGLLTPGNLDLTNRLVIKNSDGTHSSEYSFSFEDDNGHEVLVPTVVNGKFLTPDGKKPKEGSAAEKEMFKKAQQHYEQTGEHLGVFDTPGHADSYADAVHNRNQVSPDLQRPARFPTAVEMRPDKNNKMAWFDIKGNRLGPATSDESGEKE